MSINATLFGELLAFIYILSILLFTWLSYALGKRKTTTPKLVALIGGVIALVPFLALIYIAVLSLKADLKTDPT
ncbi:MAG: hypothetical protein ACTH7Q_13300 [Pseudoalteromonas sp.]